MARQNKLDWRHRRKVAEQKSRVVAFRGIGARMSYFIRNLTVVLSIVNVTSGIFIVNLLNT
ncbi:MAG: hypothetical protein NC238_08810, partial [Dehalobacter sp.]|nr:hypothetical protein [Dehalobacter sp.]